MLRYAFTILLHVACTELPATEFPFEYREGLIWVDVAVQNSSRPLRFLLDSGAEVSAVDFDVVKRLGIPLGRKVKVRGVNSTTTGFWPQEIQAVASGVRLPAKYLALNLSQLSGACERRVDGLIGADFFHGRTVQIDFIARRVRVLPSVPIGDWGQAIPLEIRRCGMRLKASVNTEEMKWVRLDTGCASEFQSVTGRTTPLECDENMAVGLAKLSIPTAKAAVTFGSYHFSNVSIGFHRKSIFPGESGLVGNGLLARFSVITIDAQGGRLFLATKGACKD